MSSSCSLVLWVKRYFLILRTLAKDPASELCESVWWRARGPPRQEELFERPVGELAADPVYPEG